MEIFELGGKLFFCNEDAPIEIVYIWEKNLNCINDNNVSKCWMNEVTKIILYKRWFEQIVFFFFFWEKISMIFVIVEVYTSYISSNFK